MTRSREGRPVDGEAGARAPGDDGTTGGWKGHLTADGSRPADAPGRSTTPAADAARGPAPIPPRSRSPAPTAAPESPFIAQSEVRVRYVETDQMGVVHHSNYFAWFEIGRTDFIRALGTSYAQLERDGFLLAIAEASVRYLSGAHYDDVLVVRTRLERVQSRSVTFGYEVVRVEPEPSVRVATANMKLIALDRAGSPRTLPSDFRRLLESVAAPPAASGA